MKNLKEKQFAQKCIRLNLGFAPSLESIVLLESTGKNGKVDYVLCEIAGQPLTAYRCGKYALEIETNSMDLSLINNHLKGE